MNPIYLLKNLGLLKNNKTVLDVGARDGIVSSQFSELGMDVDAIDIHKPESEIVGVNFEEISVENFLKKNDKNYHIVIARHVMHLLDNPKKIIEDLNKISGVFFFTCFGPKDDWSERVSVLSHEEILKMFKLETVRHHSEAFQYAKTYAGDMKYWHVHTFVIDNRV